MAHHSGSGLWVTLSALLRSRLYQFPDKAALTGVGHRWTGGSSTQNFRGRVYKPVMGYQLSGKLQLSVCTSMVFAICLCNASCLSLLYNQRYPIYNWGMIVLYTPNTIWDAPPCIPTDFCRMRGNMYRSGINSCDSMWVKLRILVVYFPIVRESITTSSLPGLGFSMLPLRPSGGRIRFQPSDAGWLHDGNISEFFFEILWSIKGNHIYGLY